MPGSCRGLAGREVQEVIPAEKRCAKCSESKPFTAFGVDRSRSDGRAPYCKTCRGKRGALPKQTYALKATYDIDLRTFGEMYLGQDGRCLLCDRRFSKDNPFRVDHDHTTGRVRGLLCEPCNISLGYVEKKQWPGFVGPDVVIAYLNGGTETSMK